MTSYLPALAVAIAMILVVMTLGPFRVGAHSEPCPFNPLCSCSNSHRDVSCIGVPFAEIPLMPMDDLFQLTLLKAGIEVLHDHSFKGTRISSLRMMQNEIALIHPKAFQGSELALTTVDLSFNKLHRLPIEALQKLRRLQWLSLHSNDIDEWPSLPSKPHLHSVFLGDNRVAYLGDGAFSNLHNLTSLDLDQNCLVEIDPQAFPPSLQTLSLSNNLLTQVPLAALQNLRNLTWLQLGGNLLDRVPRPLSLPVRQLHKLDLSHNLLTRLQSGFLNESSLSVKNLHLEFNYVRLVDRGAFRGLESVERLSLSNNRLSQLADGAFEGLQDILRALDLSHNLLSDFPPALRELTALRHLYLRGNSLNELRADDLYGCRYELEVLDLSANLLKRVPKEALRVTQRLARLSLQDNRIETLDASDFEEWAGSLTALNMANNRLRRLPHDAFLAPKLRELRLSYNGPPDPRALEALPTLEVLELGSVGRAPAIPPLPRLKWLQLDRGGLREGPALEGAPALIHVDLEGNRLRRVPAGLFRGDVHTRLNSAVLANNVIETVEPDAFHRLPLLASLVLFGNRLEVLPARSFRDLPVLGSLVLARNRIRRLEADAFSNLPALNTLLLQDNLLTDFSLDAFRRVGEAVALDLSRNRIERLLPPEDQAREDFIGARSIDLSSNRLNSIDPGFLRPLGNKLHRLVVSDNKLAYVEADTFLHARRLQELDISRNKLESLPLTRCCPQLQRLDASHNSLTSFRVVNLTTLRVLDLADNKLEVLDSEALVATSLERLNVSGNALSRLRGLDAVRATLRYLDVSRNRLSSAEGIPARLLALDLSGNSLTSLRGLGRLPHLLRLDASRNALWRLDEEPFRPLVSLRELRLSDAGLAHVPGLPLPALRRLDLSRNLLYNVSASAFAQLRELRRLDLSHNYLGEVPSHLWSEVERLADLDLSHNPVQVLSMNSFRKLDRLRQLDLRGLDLKHLDSRILYHLRFLTTFKTSTYPGLRSFRLQNLLSKSNGLKRVVVEVEETSLSHQLQWTFGTKLRDLTVTGRNLQFILPDAFLGLQTHELVLRITGTSVTKLPKGLLKYLADIRYLTLDLRGNGLTSMDPEVLMPATNVKADGYTTQHISGGVMLEDNPWVCGCGLFWLGGWIRRWMRETLRVQMLHLDGFLYAQNLARKTTCIFPGENTSVPLVELEPADFGCKDSNNHNDATKLTDAPELHFWLTLTAAMTAVLYYYNCCMEYCCAVIPSSRTS